MDIRKVKKLIEMLEESNLNEIEIKEGEEAVKLVKSNPISGNFISSTPPIISEPTQQSPIAKPSAPSIEETSSAEIGQTSETIESGNKMNSPMVGTFYSAPNPESEPFVKVGDQINEGDVLCIIEAMKMMNEVKSEFSGTVKQILVDNAEPVEFDQTLFVIS